MYQPELNKDFVPQQIADFILDNDKDGLFKSAALNKEFFINAIRRMDAVDQIIVFVNDGKLWGTLGWCFTTEDRKNELSKQVWRLPRNITQGDILYLSFIATKGNCNIVGVKKLFEEWGYRERINYRRGFTKNGWYQKKIFKTEESCLLNR